MQVKAFVNRIVPDESDLAAVERCCEVGDGRELRSLYRDVVYEDIVAVIGNTFEPEAHAAVAHIVVQREGVAGPACIAGGGNDGLAQLYQRKSLVEGYDGLDSVAIVVLHTVMVEPEREFRVHLTLKRDQR